MAHFAKIDDNNIVISVIVAEQDFIDTLEDKHMWIQTSRHTRGNIHYDPVTNEPDEGIPLRKNYAGIGYTYNSEIDGFVPPKKYDSWVLNKETGLWEAPIPMPSKEGYEYFWNESNGSWIEQVIPSQEGA